MEKRDWLMDQIEQLGRVLGKILSDFLKLKSQGRTARAVELCREELNTALDLDTGWMLTASKEALAVSLKDRNLTPEHLETLSGLMRENGLYLLKSDPGTARNYLLRTVWLLELADEFSQALSLERLEKREEIQQILSEL